MRGDRVVSHDGAPVLVIGSPRVCPIPGVEVFSVPVLIQGPIVTGAGAVYDGGFPADVWVEGLVPAGLRVAATVRFAGLMLCRGPVFWADAVEVLDAADVPVNVVEVRS